jgi:4-carboxymuconolactone decarboxylase
MTRLTRTPADMTDKQVAFFDEMAEGRAGAPNADGQLGGPFDGWCLNPSVGRRIWNLGGAVRFKSSIDRRYIELAILVTGQLWKAQFEWFAHETMARDAGLPENVIQSIKVGEEPTFDDNGDETAWRLCTMLHRDKRVDDATYAAAVAEHGEAGVADLIHALGYYVLVCMTLNTFQVPLPDGVEPPFPDHLY